MCGLMIPGGHLKWRAPFQKYRTLQRCPYAEPSSFRNLLALGPACHTSVTSAALQFRGCLKLARGGRSVAFPGDLKDPVIFLGQWKELSVFLMDDHGEVGWPWLRKWAWSSSFGPGC